MTYCSRMKLYGHVETQLVIHFNSDRRYWKEGNVKDKIVTLYHAMKTYG
jgi:hypothetical protein